MNFAPLPAFLGGFDARPWASTLVATRDGDNITLGAEALERPDVLDFLNGRRSGAGYSADADLLAGLTASVAPGAPGVIQMQVHPTLDRLFLYSDTWAFTVQGQASGEVWGCGAAVLSSAVLPHPVTGAAVNLVVFPGEWSRGNFSYEDHAGLLVTPTGKPAFAFPAQVSKVQGVITALRASTVSDLDTPTLAPLEDLDRTATGFGGTRWGLTDDGHVFYSYPQAVGSHPITWVSTTLRDRLGFTGAELDVLSTVGAAYTCTATCPCPGVLVPSRPLMVGPERESVDTTRSLDLISGTISSIRLASWVRWHVEGQVDGPADLVDLSGHYVARCWGDTWYAGARMTIIPEWGDGRRAWVLPSTNYSTLYTSYDGGMRGRLIGRLVSDSPASRRLSWGSGLRRALPFAVSIQEGP